MPTEFFFMLWMANYTINVTVYITFTRVEAQDKLSSQSLGNYLNQLSQQLYVLLSCCFQHLGSDAL